MINTLAARFWAKVPERGVGCWEWSAARNERGYGRIFVERGADGKKRFAFAHRASWEIHNGAIADGMHVCHHCDNPCCVRPDHLFLGTRTDNMQDCRRKGRNAARFRGATHCVHGHAFDAANTRFTKKGERVCRACLRDIMRRRRASAKAAREENGVVPKKRQRHIPNGPTCGGGHPWTEGNTYWHKGKRYCRACRKAYLTERQRWETV